MLTAVSALLSRCNQCGRESKLISKFYELELNIQGHKQLSDCITEFLKVPVREGEGPNTAAPGWGQPRDLEGHASRAGWWDLLADWLGCLLKPAAGLALFFPGQEEKLEGDNRYFCETCQSKQNATRRIRLLSLPCTLNLQLMRFVFDRSAASRTRPQSLRFRSRTFPPFVALLGHDSIRVSAVLS